MVAIEVLAAPSSRRALSFCDCYEMAAITAIAIERWHLQAMDLVLNRVPQSVNDLYAVRKRPIRKKPATV